MADSERVLGTEVATVLSVVRRDEAGDETAIDADSTPTAEIRRLGLLVQSVAAEDVSHLGTGSYSFTWTPALVGIFVVTWSFTVGGEDYEEVEKVRVVAEVEGTSDSDLAAEPDPTVPAIGEGNVCLVTGSFYDAGGSPVDGVFVRFAPDRESSSFTRAGIVALDVTAEADEDGVFSFYLVRGLVGTLSVTGLGIVRQVTVPDTGTISLADLVELGDDLLEVQRPRFKKLPRRS